MEQGLVYIIVSGIGTLAGYALLKVVKHEGRIIRCETRQEGMDVVLREIKEDIKEIKETLMRRE